MADDLIPILERWTRAEGRYPSPVEVAAILNVEGWTAHPRNPALAALLRADADLYVGPWGDALREAARLAGG